MAGEYWKFVNKFLPSPDRKTGFVLTKEINLSYHRKTLFTIDPYYAPHKRSGGRYQGSFSAALDAAPAMIQSAAAGV